MPTVELVEGGTGCLGCGVRRRRAARTGRRPAVGPSGRTDAPDQLGVGQVRPTDGVELLVHKCAADPSTS